jgi:hypothetical protein
MRSSTNSGSPGPTTVALLPSATTFAPLSSPRRGSPHTASPRQSPTSATFALSDSKYSGRLIDPVPRSGYSPESQYSPYPPSRDGSHGGRGGSSHWPNIDLHSNLATLSPRLRTFLNQAGIFGPAGSTGYDPDTATHHIGGTLELNSDDNRSLPAGVGHGTQLNDDVPDMSPAARAAYRRTPDTPLSFGGESLASAFSAPPTAVPAAKPAPPAATKAPPSKAKPPTRARSADGAPSGERTPSPTGRGSDGGGAGQKEQASPRATIPREARTTTSLDSGPHQPGGRSSQSPRPRHGAHSHTRSALPPTIGSHPTCSPSATSTHNSGGPATPSPQSPASPRARRSCLLVSLLGPRRYN